MRILERSLERKVVVSPEGPLNAAGAQVLEARVSAIVRRGDNRVILDGRRISYISSAGLRALLVGAKSCGNEGGTFIIAALRPECREVVNVSGLLSVLDYHETVEAALAASGEGGVKSMPEDGGETTIEERREEVAVVLSVSGRLDGSGAPLLEARVSTVVAAGNARVALDCSRMSYVNSAGLRGLLVSAKTCQQSGGRFVIAALQPSCRSVVDMSGFRSVMDCRETLEAALAALS